ncbi:hypothetical protein GCM10018965_018960 [Nonomuraea roseola]
MLEADPRFAEFVAERGDALLRYGHVLAGNPHDAADLVQEALLKLRARRACPSACPPRIRPVGSSATRSETSST